MTEEQRRRPPPPKRPPPPLNRGSASGGVSQEQRKAISVEALGLLSEQLSARVVHYRADLATNAELDAITAQVVAQVRAIQDEASNVTTTPRSAETIEKELSETLSRLIQRLLTPRGGTVEFLSHWISPVGKRVAKLFFESELHERSPGNKERVIRSAAQGVYYVLARYANRLQADLESFEYHDSEVRCSTFERFEKLATELRTEFLSRRSPELQKVMGIFTEVLSEFLSQVISKERAIMARSVIEQSRIAHQPTSVGYKVTRDSFPAFRTAWEKEWMERWVTFASERFVSALQVSDEPFLDETVRFFTDPHLYSETAAVLCEAVYDYLCQEGFLDLPLDWRVQMNAR